MNIINVGYDSTNYYLISNHTTRLLIDVGFPGTLPKLLHTLKRKGVALTDIRYLLCTHYHPDHAGLAQEVKQQGIKLLVLENQLTALAALGSYLKSSDNYRPIELADAHQWRFAESRKFLRGMGIEGEIICTPGHSEDSITLVLDEGRAFTGDLTHPAQTTEDPQDMAATSWQRIRALGIETIYPGHGPIQKVAQLWPVS